MRAGAKLGRPHRANPAGGCDLDPAWREALAWRRADHRRDPHRHPGVCRRQCCQLDGTCQRPTIRRVILAFESDSSRREKWLDVTSKSSCSSLRRSSSPPVRQRLRHCRPLWRYRQPAHRLCRPQACRQPSRPLLRQLAHRKPLRPQPLRRELPPRCLLHHQAHLQPTEKRQCQQANQKPVKHRYG